MTTYLFWSGAGLNVIFVGAMLYVLWVLVVWPMIEAVSMCRWYSAIGKKYPTVKPTNGWLPLWWSCVAIGGRHFDATSNKYGRWAGVGQWSVYSGDEH